jgi:hypothetical protein
VHRSWQQRFSMDGNFVPCHGLLYREPTGALSAAVIVAELSKNREVGTGWPVHFVLHVLLSGRITENLPAHFSFSCGMPVK